MNHNITFVFFISLLVSTTNSYKILGLFPLPIKSHFIFFEAILKGLVERGHEVYVVSHFPQKNPTARYNDINISGSIPYDISNISISYKLFRSVFGMAWHIYKTCGSEICEYLMKNPKIIALKKNPLKFDVVISEIYGTDCLLGFAHHFNVPIIGASSTDLLPWSGTRMGNPDNPSHVSNYLGFNSLKMNIFEKIYAVGLTIATKIGYFCISTVVTEMRSREFFGKTFPPMENLIYNTSILLSNTHFSFTEPRPVVPGIIEVGGAHIRKPKPVSQEIEVVLMGSVGIYFSLGSVINSKSLQQKEIEIFVDTFSKLPYQIIWSGISNISVPKWVNTKNIHLFEWVDQLDVLCHPNIKAFITHGGLLSIQETIYCGKPILGIPIFPDQQRNVERIVQNGAGILKNINDLNQTILIKNLNHLVRDEMFRENAEKLSNLFQDRPIPPLNQSTYWIEYVIRHRGAAHIKSKGVEMTWFEYYLIDVYLLFLTAFLIFFKFCLVLLDVLQNYFENQNYDNIERNE
ncbi:UDP-glucosyltransferase 2-like [Onthophagus taurus]|uniref:UDP-glucosyltransferase 2-like n=1 Tax=Onthophagus taurus TaxID=166361 RepID=UPI0039BDA648